MSEMRKRDQLLILLCFFIVGGDESPSLLTPRPTFSDIPIIRFESEKMILPLGTKDG